MDRSVFFMMQKYCAVLLLSAVPVFSSCEKTEGQGDGNGNGGGGGDSASVLVEQARESLIMDVVFNEDGTAQDASPRANNVARVPGENLLVYYNSVWGGYVPHFTSDPGETVKEGYYKVYYNSDRQFRYDMEDGFSAETMFLLDAETDGSKELKMFSSTEKGGAGFLVTKAELGKKIAFVAYFGTSASSTPVYVVGNTSPERGKVYHAVATWDKESSEVSLYVNGVMENTMRVSGDFVLPSSSSYQWFGIGADSGVSAENAWKGEVFVARVYGEAFSSETVSALYSVSEKDFDSESILLDDVLLFSGCEVSAGQEYMVLGHGYEQGDKIRMLSSDGESDNSLDCTAYSGKVVFNLPDGLTSGTYTLFLERGQKQCPLGNVSLTVVSDAAPLKSPGIVAHRGFHTYQGGVENSMAALKATQDLGAYGCETDVWITMDGVLVMHHDGIVNGKRIENSTYDQIKDYRLPNGESLPLLQQMLEQISTGKGGTKLIVEIKEHSTAERNQLVTDAVIEAVAAAGAGEHVEYICFDRDVCRRIASACPDAMVGYLMGDAEPEDLLSEGIRCIDYPFQTFANTPSIVKDAHSAGMVTNIWTVNTDKDIMSSISMGLDLVTTDYPDRLKEICMMMEGE